MYFYISFLHFPFFCLFSLSLFLPLLFSLLRKVLYPFMVEWKFDSVEYIETLKSRYFILWIFIKIQFQRILRINVRNERAQRLIKRRANVKQRRKVFNKVFPFFFSFVVHSPCVFACVYVSCVPMFPVTQTFDQEKRKETKNKERNNESNLIPIKTWRRSSFIFSHDET